MSITNGEDLAPRDRHFPCRVNPRPEACGSWEETVETTVHSPNSLLLQDCHSDQND